MSEEVTLDEFVTDEESAKQDESDEWLRLPITEISEWTDAGGTPRTSNDEYWGGSIPWVQTGELTKRHISSTEKHITELGLEESTAKRFPPGTLLIGMYGEPTVGESALLEVEATTNQACCGIYPDTDTVNAEFLHQTMQYEKPRLYSLRAGSGQQNIRQGIIRKFEIDVPPLSEQRKIATVLYTVDQAIQKTEEIIEQLGRAKEGLYQTLFSEGYQEHSRFKSSKYGEIPESWRVLKLSEITSQIQAGGTPDTNKPEYYGGDIPWVKTGELSQYRVTETEQKITKKGLKESTARLFSPGTILIAMYGATTGEVSLLDIEATTNQACCGVVTTDKMKPEFLFHQLNHLSNHLESLSAGSGQQNISKGIIEKFDVLVPTVEEQNSIVSVLNSVDESIAENKYTKEQYQRLKQGLMQDLLSGTVRTTDTNIEVPDEIAQHG